MGKFFITEEEKKHIRLLYEQQPQVFDKNYFTSKPSGEITVAEYGVVTNVNGIEVSDSGTQFDKYFNSGDGWRGWKAGTYPYKYEITQTMRKPDGEYTLTITDTNTKATAYWVSK